MCKLKMKRNASTAMTIGPLMQQSSTTTKRDGVAIIRDIRTFYHHLAGCYFQILTHQYSLIMAVLDR